MLTCQSINDSSKLNQDKKIDAFALRQEKLKAIIFNSSSSDASSSDNEKDKSQLKNRSEVFSDDSGSEISRNRTVKGGEHQTKNKQPSERQLKVLQRENFKKIRQSRLSLENNTNREQDSKNKTMVMQQFLRKFSQKHPNRQTQLSSSAWSILQQQESKQLKNQIDTSKSNHDDEKFTIDSKISKGLDMKRILETHKEISSSESDVAAFDHSTRPRKFATPPKKLTAKNFKEMYHLYPIQNGENKSIRLPFSQLSPNHLHSFRDHDNNKLNRMSDKSRLVSILKHPHSNANKSKLESLDIESKVKHPNDVENKLYSSSSNGMNIQLKRIQALRNQAVKQELAHRQVEEQIQWNHEVIESNNVNDNKEVDDEENEKCIEQVDEDESDDEIDEWRRSPKKEILSKEEFTDDNLSYTNSTHDIRKSPNTLSKDDLSELISVNLENPMTQYSQTPLSMDIALPDDHLLENIERKIDSPSSVLFSKKNSHKFNDNVGFLHYFKSN